MSLLFETLCIRDGRIFNLPFHQDRVNRAFAQYFPSYTPLDLASILAQIPLPSHGLHKCRILYENSLYSVAIEPYQPRHIQTLRLVLDESISYAHKLLDRSHLHQLFQYRDGCDDILIVQQGHITDTSYANVVLWNGSTWITPDPPLLPGTQRASLLQQQRIHLAPVSIHSLYREYTHIGVINAMNPWETMTILPIHAIKVPPHLSLCS